MKNLDFSLFTRSTNSLMTKASPRIWRPSKNVVWQLEIRDGRTILMHCAKIFDMILWMLVMSEIWRYFDSPWGCLFFGIRAMNDDVISFGRVVLWWNLWTTTHTSSPTISQHFMKKLRLQPYRLGLFSPSKLYLP